MKLHLPKGLFTAILAAFAVVTPSVYGADSISISFGSTTMSGMSDEASQLGGVTKDGWNIVPASNTNGTTVNNQNGTAAGTLVMSGIFGSYNSSVTDTTTVLGVVQRNYIDIKNYDGGNVHTISLSHNYWLADVTYYLSGDAGGTWAPMEVNGTQYIGGTDNTLDEGENPAWGTRGGVTEYGDGNSITVTGLAGGTIVGKNVYTSGTARATLGGMQVVDSSATRGYMTTLGAGETTATAATWTLNGQEVQYGNISTPKSLGVSAAAEGSTLKLASGDSINSIAVQANTLTVASDGTIGLNDIYLNSGTTFNLNAGITSGTNLSVRGAGTAHINASQALGSLSSLVSTLGIGGNSTITVSGAASFAGLDVAAGSKLALNGSVDGSFILNTTGSGTIELNNGATVIIPGANNGKPGDGGTASAVNSTAFAGVISVKSGTLSLGDNGTDQNYWGLNLGSLKSIDLDGGSMRLFGAASTISTINVNTASSMTIHQASVTQSSVTGDAATSGVPGYRINNLVLNENLSIRTNWRSVVEIGKLSGAADLSMDTAGSDRVLSLYVNKVDATAGMNINFAANVNATLGGAANSELTDVSHTLGGTITTAANLTVNGSITIVDDLSAFVMLSAGSVSGELSVNGTDGYMTTNGSTYLLVDNTGSGTVNFSPTTATYAGSTITLTQDATTGDVTFVGGTSLDTIYRVNTADVTVGGSNATENAARATSFIIAKDRTVTIAGASDTASTSSMLYNSTGEGNVTLTAEASLARQQATQATGKLTISNGARLNLGNGDLKDSEYSVPGASISSFTAVELDDGTIYVNNPDGTINNLSVTAKGGTIDVYDMGQAGDDKWLTLAETTTLNGDLKLTSTWNTQIAVNKLAGTGNVVINDDRKELMTLNINGKDANYSGQVQVQGNAGNLQVNVAENLGLDVHVSTRSGEMNLNGIAVGNQIILQGASGSMTAGSTVVADVKIENSADGQYAGMEIATAADNATMKYTGTVTGGGNYIVLPSKTVTVDGTNQKVSVSTTTEFAGDTSGWTGKMEVVNGTQNVIYSGSEIISNSEIKTRSGSTDVTIDNPVMNLTIKHDTAAVTVNSAISGSVNMTVNATEGATFTKSVTATTTTLADDTTATFNGTSNLGSLTLGAGASIAGAGNLTIGELILDLQSYTSDFGQSHTLVSTTGTLSFTGDLSQFQNVTVGDYTANVEQNGNAITLSFSAPDAPDTSIITTVTGQSGFADGMLTLNVAADLTDATQVLISGISDSIMADILGLSDLPENGMVGITLAGADGTTFTATADQQIGFQGNDGVSYYFGEQVGSAWQYQVAYIPEPASATLGLAALMMLAARRRRKA